MYKGQSIYRLIILIIIFIASLVAGVGAQTAAEPNDRGNRFNPIGEGAAPQVEYDPQSAPLTPRPVGARRAAYDFFGSGRTSFAVFTGAQESRILWKMRNNGGDETSVVNWGRRDFSFTDFAAPGYYDGDDKADIAVFRKNLNDLSASYFVNPSTATDSMQVVRWGAASDFHSLGDYDGDGRDDFTVTRRSGGNWVWYILRSSDNSFSAIPFGSETANGRTDATMRGADYNGDGRDDLVVRRADDAGNVTYYVGDSATGALILAQQWGRLATDTFVSGDYLGDARADFAVWRGTGSGADGYWYIRENGGDGVLYIPFGIAGDSTDRAIRGDYNGDGKDDIAVFRNRTSTFYWLNSPDYTTLGGFQFGAFGDVPVAGL